MRACAHAQHGNDLLPKTALELCLQRRGRYPGGGVMNEALAGDDLQRPVVERGHVLPWREGLAEDGLLDLGEVEL
eukprot:CAMPEP_0202079876 /NCGR_PEP_ID=MMETSP0964-20121228/6734_1 /ASSEMBLY_ACC=CAM_ASM_000500 /TAXON_ID=4773 /ORGANISM="Schizochytrium aggregatum, Strain ATCC28209" /LENGTH=74 /DNA_ID=CAMNT_0048647233 /DNA_START=214 /DNA_END=435 /DNA_ORIENTATION=+